jgi:hypothetical protein
MTIAVTTLLDKPLKSTLNNTAKNHLNNYIKNYAEKEIDNLVTGIAKTLSPLKFNHCLTIPAYNESDHFIKSLINNLDNQIWSNTLIIVVINQPDTDNNIIQNQALWSTLIGLNFKSSNNDSANEHYITLNHSKSCSSIIALDFFSENRKLAKKKGVGLARKIGCDLACHFVYQKILVTDWLHTSDADTQLPNNYFEQTASITSIRTSAAVYDFAHTGEDNIVTQSTQLYEKSLHYYVEGLRFAHSIYAYHTLGSCIAINARSYILVRGFTKRAGGEDFYCLNKLAKIGDIKQLHGDNLIINARNSDRVPFGTGPAVEKILKNSDSISTLLTYNPIVFYLLKNLLVSFESLFNHKDNPYNWLERQPKEIKSALQEIHIDILFNHIKSQIKDKKSCIRHTHQWFDAFKTLKFIHVLEQHYPKVSLEKAENQLKAGFEA